MAGFSLAGMVWTASFFLDGTSKVGQLNTSVGESGTETCLY